MPLLKIVSPVTRLMLEEIESGVVHSAQSVYTEYPDPRREEWENNLLPVLRKLPVKVLMRFTNKSRSMLTRTLAGRSRPRRRNQALLTAALRKIDVL
jgi:hypothetical protein